MPDLFVQLVAFGTLHDASTGGQGRLSVRNHCLLVKHKLS